jgi:excisionase family DNA binding protein
VALGQGAHIPEEERILFLKEDLLDYLRSRRVPMGSEATTTVEREAPSTAPAVERVAYSAREAAQAMDLPYLTVLAEIRAKRLVARRAGKEYRIHRASLDEYLLWQDPKLAPASTSVPTRTSGSSVTLASPKSASLSSAKMAAEKLKRPSRVT